MSAMAGDSTAGTVKSTSNIHEIKTTTAPQIEAATGSKGSPRRRFSISSRQLSPNGRSTSFARLRVSNLLPAKEVPPAHEAPFSVPSIAWQQKGGFYSDAELPRGNVEGCPNRKNPIHYCTRYCFEKFAPLSTQERFLAAATAGAHNGGTTSRTKKSAACRVS